MARLVVLENPANWNLDLPEAEIVAARDYLSNPRFSERRRTKVFNLCRNYGYQSVGYYVSLLAEARGHRPLPPVATLQDLRLSPVVKVVSQELEDIAAKVLGPGDPPEVGIDLFFGRSPKAAYDRLTQALYRYFPSPFLHADFKFVDGWRLNSVRPIGTSEIREADRAFVADQMRRHFRRSSPEEAAPTTALRYDLAILYDPEEAEAPSDEIAIRKFIKAAHGVGIDASVISKDDYGRLAEYDALFIRETTSVNHHTYRFARRAEAEGLVVIDSPQSIVRCGNKVYQAEVFARNGVDCPRSVILHKDNAPSVGEQLGYPVVLKRPDSAFSLGVVRADNPGELQDRLATVFRNSELAVAQEFVTSGFDWRIGVLDGQAFYACKYHMAPGHWQIRGTGGGPARYGKVETVRVEDAPAAAVDVALRAAALMGHDLYGVDVKELDGRFMVMEVNDNPSLEAGDEDAILKDELYAMIMRSFLRRLEARGVTAS